MGALISLAIGLAIGYLSLRLGDLGQLIMGLLLTLLILYYLNARRPASASALAIGAGGVVAIWLGSVILNTITDPAVHTEAPTYIGFMVGFLVIAIGLGIGLLTRSRRG
jgi:hypothetical protein